MARTVIDIQGYKALSSIRYEDGKAYNQIIITFNGDIVCICEVDLGHKAAYNMARSFIRRAIKSNLYTHMFDNEGM